MVKGDRVPTKELQDVNWSALDHASHAPQLSLATITCTRCGTVSTAGL